MSQSAAAAMRAAIHDLLDGLSREQRERACLPFEDHAERTNWAYFPRRTRGVALADLDHRQQKLVQRVVESGLSPQAYARARQVMAIDDVLDGIERGRVTHFRDPALFYLALFVDDTQLFEPVRGWRFEGHHISLNYTFARDGLLAVSPQFLGSNPARISHNGFDIYRPLGDAEDLARELLDALSPELRAKAVVHPEAPGDIVLANLPFVAESDAAANLLVRTQMTGRGVPVEPFAALRFDPAHPLGVAAEDLSAGQRELLARLVAHYADRFPAGATWDGFSDSRELHFAWAGSAEVGAPHYYRLQGPSLVVEYDNTQDGANHVHTVVRHPANDFGRAALALHHLREH